MLQVDYFGGSAWMWDELRKQYYFHQYDSAQPDLNWRNPKVLEAMEVRITGLDMLTYPRIVSHQ